MSENGEGATPTNRRSLLKKIAIPATVAAVGKIGTSLPSILHPESASYPNSENRVTPTPDVSRVPITPTATETEPRVINCPTYTFHEVLNQRDFAAFVDDLIRKNFEPITPTQLLSYIKTGTKSWTKQPTMITFDDGYLSVLKNAVPVLLEKKVKAAFAVMPNWKGDGDPKHVYMQNKDIQELARLGFEIMSHTLNHANLAALRQKNEGAWAAEIVDSQKVLKQLTGQPINFFVYPFGREGHEVDQKTIDLVSKHYQGAFTTTQGKMQTSQSLYTLKRTGKT